MALIPLGKSLALAAVFLLFILVEASLGKGDIGALLKGKKGLIRYTSYYSLLLAIIFLANFDAEPYFIYFQF